MPNNLAADPRALGEPTDSRKPLSSLCREIGLAAVAIELNLEPSTLQPDAVEAIEQGAAALFDAGYGPSVILDTDEPFGPARKPAIKRCGAGQVRQDNPGRSLL
jgi:hypothetical protein